MPTTATHPALFFSQAAATLALLLTSQIASASSCSNDRNALTNRCNGLRCYKDFQCASGYCMNHPFDDDDDEGLCAPNIPWWGWVLIVLGAILVIVALCCLCCCCCKKRRNNRLTQKLDERNKYEGQGYQEVPSMQYPD